MENIYNTPAETIDGNIKAGVTKANLNIWKMIIMGLMAGAFIAIGGQASNVAVHNIQNVGLARLLAGTVFPVGLMMIVLVGGELFTGNCLLIMDIMDKKVTVLQMLRNLVVVYFSNMAGTAKDIIGKLFAIFFPIMAFVTSGFEHCVANMFYIPAGMFAATNPNYVQVAEEAYGMTADQIHSALSASGYLSNLIPVTLGNIVGGMLCVGIVYYEINKSKFMNPSKDKK